MRSRLIAVVAAAALTLVPIAGSSAVADRSAGGSPVATIACQHAKIGGKRKCIARGQFCARRYERDYNRYGLSCSKKDRNGRYHLQ